MRRLDPGVRSQRWRRLLLAAGGAWLVATSAAAQAQVRDAAAGEALFQEGRRLMKAGDFAGACPKLEESLRLDPASGTLVNLASCEEQLGHTASAWQHWRAAADELPPGDKRRAMAVARAAGLEKVLPRLTITAAELPPGAEVKRDGVQLGRASLGLPLPVDPGRHALVVTAPGHEDRPYEITVRAGESQTLAVQVGAEVKEPPPVVASAPERWDEKPPAVVATAPAAKRSSALGWTLLGGGALALAGAGYFGLRALNARKEARADCPGDSPSLCWNDAQAPLDRDKRSSLIADLGLGLGAILAGAGLYFIISGPGGETATAQVSPLPGGGAVHLTGRF
jgi:tetratricopeptide (TPR) repeat protein